MRPLGQTLLRLAQGSTKATTAFVASEIVHTEEGRRVPREFKWRGRILTTKHAQGPERIAPEWWLDDPNWRSGVRDYWQVTCHEGVSSGSFMHGAALGAEWFCQGRFV